MKITALAGGVGGAKLVDGLAAILGSGELEVIVNTGDDFTHLGLKICPDVDTVVYTLAGLANPETGWGRKEESWEVLSELEKIGGNTWFKLGDKDLAWNLERTHRLSRGESLTEVVETMAAKVGVSCKIIPMTDDPVPTLVHTKDNRVLGFQEYFVHEKCVPPVRAFEYKNYQMAHPTKEVLNSLTTADLIVLCPSNPWVSIGPILCLPGIRELVRIKRTLAVSPIIGGQTLKGPAAKMFSELGITPSAVSVAEHYRDLLWGFVMDDQDRDQAGDILAWGIIPFVTDTIMRSKEDRIRLAQEVLAFGLNKQGGSKI